MRTVVMRASELLRHHIRGHGYDPMETGSARASSPGPFPVSAASTASARRRGTARDRKHDRCLEPVRLCRRLRSDQWPEPAIKTAVIQASARGGHIRLGHVERAKFCITHAVNMRMNWSSEAFSQMSPKSAKQTASVAENRPGCRDILGALERKRGTARRLLQVRRRSRQLEVKLMSKASVLQSRKAIFFNILVGCSPKWRSHQVRRISALRDRSRATWRQDQCSAPAAQPSKTTEKSGRSRIGRTLSRG